jgi:hypothetical protein
MTTAPNGSFYSKLEDERCRANLRGCTGTQEIRIHCNTEGTDVSVCRSCATVWRLNARASGLYDRCPLCALWKPEYAAHREAPAAPAILTGPAADAIEAAMHQEGLLYDVRTKVLRRLAKEAPWLFFGAPDELGSSATAIPDRVMLPDSTFQ